VVPTFRKPRKVGQPISWWCKSEPTPSCFGSRFGEVAHPPGKWKVGGKAAEGRGNIALHRASRGFFSGSASFFAQCLEPFEELLVIVSALFTP
jgi:hypothetical protein